MGLDFSHGDAHWSYRGFNRFRERLATIIGFNLREMDGFTYNGLSWGLIDDPVKDLLNHSDCDGELTPEQCSIIVPRLKELISNWNEDDWDRQGANDLIEGMQEAIANNENLEFK